MIEVDTNRVKHNIILTHMCTMAQYINLHTLYTVLRIQGCRAIFGTTFLHVGTMDNALLCNMQPSLVSVLVMLSLHPYYFCRLFLETETCLPNLGWKQRLHITYDYSLRILYLPGEAISNVNTPTGIQNSCNNEM